MPSQQDSPPRLSDDLTSDTAQADPTSDTAQGDLTAATQGDLSSDDLTTVIAQQEKIFVERQPESGPGWPTVHPAAWPAG